MSAGGTNAAQRDAQALQCRGGLPRVRRSLRVRPPHNPGFQTVIFPGVPRACALSIHTGGWEPDHGGGGREIRAATAIRLRSTRDLCLRPSRPFPPARALLPRGSTQAHRRLPNPGPTPRARPFARAVSARCRRARASAARSSSTTTSRTFRSTGPAACTTPRRARRDALQLPLATWVTRWTLGLQHLTLRGSGYSGSSAGYAQGVEDGAWLHSARDLRKLSAGTKYRDLSESALAARPRPSRPSAPGHAAQRSRIAEGGPRVALARTARHRTSGRCPHAFTTLMSRPWPP